MNKENKERKYLECEDCGKKDKSVRRGPCPYNEDVNNDDTLVDLCTRCHHERAMDI